MNYRVPLTSDERAMERSGFNVYDGDDEPRNCDICEEIYHPESGDTGLCQDCEKVLRDSLDERVICACGWAGTRGQLLSATGLKFDVEFIYCPICGSDDVGEL